MAARVRTIKVGEKEIGPSHPVYVIAEAGVNHNGEVSLAERMIEAAAHCGADAVKFQAYRAELIAARGAPLADYQRKGGPGARTQRKMLERFELGPDDFRELKTACEKAGVEFLASPFDLESLEMLLELGVAAVKVASPELTDTPLLERIAAEKVPALVSTGAATMKEVKTAVDVLRSGKLKDVALFHCVSAYPAPYEHSNLRAVAALEAEFRLPVGYSDHSPGIHIGAAAVGAGARLLEKHFTLDRGLPGPDQRLSLEPSELHSFVTAVRQVEKALGDGRKSPRESELDVREASRKSLVSTRRIEKGEKITGEMLTTKRPGTGIQPSEIHRITGKRARCEIPADTVLTREMIRGR